MALEIVATGVVFSVGDGATTEVFTVLPGVSGVPEFPALVPPEIDVSALDSLGGEFILGLGDPGTTSIPVNLRKKTSGAGWNAAQQVVEGYANDGVLRGFKLEVKSGATLLRTYTWKGYVKSFRLASPSANSAVTSTLEIRNSGAITVA